MKILIISAGSIGTRHFKNLLRLGYKDIAVVEPSRKAIQKLEEIKKGIKIYKNITKAFQAYPADVVFIASPTDTHLTMLNSSLNLGADVFLEKPLSHNLKGIDSLIKKAARKKSIVMVACNYRFHKGFQKLEYVLRSKKFGESLTARVVIGYYLPLARGGVDYKKIYAARKKGGGVILDSGSHAVDYLIALFGETKKVNRFESNLHSLHIEAEEMGNLFLEHEDKVQSVVSLDFVSKKPRHIIEVLTTKGLLVLDFKEDTLTFESERGKRLLYKGKKDVNQMFVDELKHFFSCLKNKSKPLQTIAEAREVIKVLLAKT